MIVVQHWSLVELQKLYGLAEKEAKEEPMSPTIEDPPPSYDAAKNIQASYYEDQAANGPRRLSIQGPAVPDKIPNDSQALVKFEEKPLHQLDQQFTLALTRENKALGAPVHDIVNYLLHEWTKFPDAEARPSPPSSRGYPSPPSSRKNSTAYPAANPAARPSYYESDEDTSDSEFERSSDIGGRYIEGPRKGVEKNVRFRARVESDAEEQDHHRSRRRTPKKHVLQHSEDDTTTDTDSDASPPPRAPGSRRSSEGGNVPYSREGPERRPRPYSGRSNGPEDAGRSITRGMSQPSVPQGRPPLNQPWQSTQPISIGLRPQAYGPPGGPPRMPNSGSYIPPGYMGQSPQPPPGTYFPQQQQRPPGLSMPPRQESHRDRDREKRRSAEKDASSASKNLRRGLFGGAAVAGILDLLQGLDGL